MSVSGHMDLFCFILKIKISALLVIERLANMALMDDNNWPSRDWATKADLLTQSLASAGQPQAFC